MKLLKLESIRRGMAFTMVAAMLVAINPMNMSVVSATSAEADKGQSAVVGNTTAGTNTQTTDTQTSAGTQTTDTQTSADTQTTDTQTSAGTQTTDTQTSAGTQTTDTQTSTGTQTTGDQTAVNTQVSDTQPVRNPELAYTGLSPADCKVLVIDPGHCNTHPGARGNGLKEEAVNLDISLAMYDELLDYVDINAYLTREDGGCCKYLVAGSDCLHARSNYALKLDADFLVSVHINAGYSSGAYALVAYNSGYHDEIRKETQAFGKIALKELHKLGIGNRGFLLRKSGSGNRYSNGKLADYYAIVRRGVVDQIPGVIMEHGYITSASDCKKYFKTKAKRKKVGVADAKAVISYYNLSKKTVKGSFVEENGATYYKNEAGVKVSGWVKSEGSWYYFDEMTGKMQKGFLTQGDNTFYLNPSTGEMVVGGFKKDGKEYLAKGNGTLVKGAIHTDGIGTYLYDEGGRKLKKGFHTMNGKTFYVVNNSKVARGLTKIGSKYYGFGTETGKMLYGEQSFGSKDYYFNPDTGVAARKEMVTIGEETYYFGSKAAKQTGWVKYKGAKYYFDKYSGEMITGWKKIKGKYYYFDEETGKMAKSKWIDNYYVNKKGVRTKKR